MRHRGRRSGRSYATPVAIAHAGDHFFIPMPFGSEADWPRNVLTAGGCVIRWKGADHEVIDPEVIDIAAGRHAFNPIEGVFLRSLGIRSILRLREAPRSVLSSSRQSVA